MEFHIPLYIPWGGKELNTTEQLSLHAVMIIISTTKVSWNWHMNSTDVITSWSYLVIFISDNHVASAQIILYLGIYPTEIGIQSIGKNLQG